MELRRAASLLSLQPWRTHDLFFGCLPIRILAPFNHPRPPISSPKRKLPDGFLLERCGHYPPISDVDCVVQRALNKQASKILLATSSEEVLVKTRYTHGLPVLYAKVKTTCVFLVRLTTRGCQRKKTNLKVMRAWEGNPRTSSSKRQKMLKRTERDEEKTRPKKADRNQLLRKTTGTVNWHI